MACSIDIAETESVYSTDLIEIFGISPLKELNLNVDEIFKDVT